MSDLSPPCHPVTPAIDTQTTHPTCVEWRWCSRTLSWHPVPCRPQQSTTSCDLLHVGHVCCCNKQIPSCLLPVHAAAAQQLRDTPWPCGATFASAAAAAAVVRKPFRAEPAARQPLGWRTGMQTRSMHAWKGPDGSSQRQIAENLAETTQSHLLQQLILPFEHVQGRQRRCLCPDAHETLPAPD